MMIIDRGPRKVIEILAGWCYCGISIRALKILRLKMMIFSCSLLFCVFGADLCAVRGLYLIDQF